MTPSTTEHAMRTIDIAKEEEIAAPIEVVFETLLEQLGPLNETGPGSRMPMSLEAWPGGRWFRDLGKGMGHLWGHVQVIKPPTLLEISGPLFMSYPAISHVQCRLTSEGGKTRLKFLHRAFGQITPEHQEGVGRGWSHILGRIREAAERRGNAARGQR